MSQWILMELYECVVYKIYIRQPLWSRGTSLHSVTMFEVSDSNSGLVNIENWVFYTVSGLNVCGTVVVFYFHITSVLVTVAEQYIWCGLIFIYILLFLDSHWRRKVYRLTLHKILVNVSSFTYVYKYFHTSLLSLLASHASLFKNILDLI